MSQSVKFLFFILVISTITLACNTPEPPAPNPTATTDPTAVVLPNLLVQVSPQTTVSRAGSDDEQRLPVGVGDRVEQGDLLYVSGGETIIFCGHPSLWSETSLPADDKAQGVPCQTGAPPRPAPNLARLRGENASAATTNLPYILAPRGGWVSQDRPDLHWLSMSGVTNATLTLISDDDITRSPITVSSNQLTYPATWEPLQAGGASYRLDIAGGQKSIGFSLLEPTQIEQLQNQEALLKQRITTELGRTLVLAELYLSYGLYSEAAASLSATVMTEGVEQTAVFHLLGKTYLDMDLFVEAQTHLEQALILVQQTPQPEIEADILALLGFATCRSLQNEPAARARWEEALAKYETLGQTPPHPITEEWLPQSSSLCLESP